MVARAVPFTLVALLGCLLAGCWTEQWIEVAGGEYVPVTGMGASGTASEIESMQVDREQQTVRFVLADGSQSVVPFVSRVRSAWPSGCPTNVRSTRMEVLDLGTESLTVASATFVRPVLIRDCPPDPQEIVLRSDGEIGGGSAACAGATRCITFEPVSAVSVLTHLGNGAGTSGATFAATSTAAVTPTVLPTITQTSTPQFLPTAVPTDTSRPLPTDAASHTPVPTATPTPTPTVSPQILSFTAHPDLVERGGTVTLAWDAPGTVGGSITRLSEQGDIFLETEALDLPSKGSITLKVPESYVESAKYYLGARDADGVLYKAYVTVNIICRYDEYIAPRCPLTRDRVWAAYEPFERGDMVWREDTGEIYVLYDDGHYESYEDTWQEGTPIDLQGTPYDGLFAPVRGFGYLYASQPHLQERLGWATATEVGYTMTVETIPGGSGRYPGTSTYFTLPDDRVVNLYPFSSTWQLRSP